MMKRCVWLPCVVMLVLAGCLRPASVKPGGELVPSPSIATAPATKLPTPAGPSPQPVAGAPQTAVPLTQTLPPPAASASPGLTPTLPVVTPPEYPVVIIPLDGPAASPEAEISGMAWYSDTLILLPEEPSRFGSGDGALLALERADILAFLGGGRRQPLTPRLIPLTAPGVAKLPGFEGFEAIAIAGERVFVTVEAHPDAMLTYLIGGVITPDLSALRLDTGRMARISPQTDIPNLGDEALLVAGARLVTLYEANGAALNPHPVAHLFDFALNSHGTLAFASLEYRLTDATPPDSYGRFWAINHFYPGDTQLWPTFDPLAAQFGQGATHSQSATVERLVEFVFTEYGIALSGTPPIQLRLLDGDQPRNWEALARLEGDLQRGFLLATDRYPQTILGFVAYP